MIFTMKKNEWFKDENFWNNYAPIMFDEQQWAQAYGIVESCCTKAELNKGDSVIDVCSGPGRLSVEFALQGMDVTCVDLNQTFLDMAQETANDEGVKLNLINHDMRTFNSRKKFDLAVNIYNSFGYCDSIEDDTKILKRIFASLKKGGKFILECISRETAVKYFTEGEWFERDGKTVLTQFKPVNDWQGLSSKWILIDKKTGKRTEHEFVQRLYSACELRDRLLQIGFKTSKVYGGFDFSPYDENAKTMVIYAEK